MTTLENIEQAERLLAELKANINEVEKADADMLRILQSKIENQYHFPKYCLNVRRDIKKYFLNKYADTIYNVIVRANTGIPLSEILKIMKKNEEGNNERQFKHLILDSIRRRDTSGYGHISYKGRGGDNCINVTFHHNVMRRNILVDEIFRREREI